VLKSVARSEHAACVKPFIDLPYDGPEAPSGVVGVELTLTRGTTLKAGEYDTRRRSFGSSALVAPAEVPRILKEFDAKLGSQLREWAARVRSNMTIPL
jgi:hypothetical protein